MSDVSERWFLVVEDDVDDARLARRAYEATGRRENLRVASNGEEALEILRAHASPALVLLDLKLPRLSGVEVLMAMQDDERLRTIPVVILTTSDEITDVAACYELGCNAFVKKPVEYDAFIAVVTSTLEFWLAINLPFSPSLRE